MRIESRHANFTAKLASAARVIIDIFVRGITDRTDGAFRGKVLTAAVDRRKWFAVFNVNIGKKLIEIKKLFDFNNRHFIYLKLSILLTHRVFERSICHIFVDKETLKIKKNFAEKFY